LENPVITTGPALASAGLDRKPFCGAHSVAFAEIFEEGLQVTMVEITSDVKERGPKG